ncbi:MAG: OmpW family outer membrane protein [Thermoanaerobaculia bacterium]
MKMMKVQILAAVLAIASLPLLAQENQVTLYGSKAMLGSGSSSGATKIDVGDGSGWGIAYSHRFAGHFGFEVAAFSLSSDAKVAAGGQTILDLGSLDYRPITAAVRYHFLPQGAFDAYVAAGGAHVSADDLSSSDLDTAGLGKINVGNDTTWMAGGGLAWRPGAHLSIGADARYIPWKPDTHSSVTGGKETLDLNPWIVSAGIGWRF